MEKPAVRKLTGVSHFFAAASYSWAGFQRLIKESAFRQELLFGAVSLHAQTSNKPKPAAVTETLVINTSAQCDMCKARIEGKLNEAKGVRMASLDIRSKKLTVKYNPEKTSPEEIRKAVNRLGYDADGQKADAEAFKNLPPCCQKH